MFQQGNGLSGLDSLLEDLIRKERGEPLPPTPTPRYEPPAEPDQEVGVMAPHQFEGMFGIKGKGRSILGLLGDAFLMQSGNKPVYAPRRQQEREANALRSLSDNPMAAIQALSKWNPEAARELYVDHVKANSQAQDRIADNDVRTMGLIGSVLQTANPSNWQGVRDIISKISRQRNYELPFELPEEYDETFIETVRYFGARPNDVYTDQYRAQRLPQIDRQINVQANLGGQRVAVQREANDIRRTDPRRVAPDRSPTPTRVIGRIMDKEARGEKLSPSEEKVLKDYRAKAGGRQKPTIKFGTRPDGTRYVIQ